MSLLLFYDLMIIRAPPSLVLKGRKGYTGSEINTVFGQMGQLDSSGITKKNML